MFAGAASVSPGVYLYRLTETGLSASVTLSRTTFFRDPDPKRRCAEVEA